MLSYAAALLAIFASATAATPSLVARAATNQLANNIPSNYTQGSLLCIDEQDQRLYMMSSVTVDGLYVWSNSYEPLLVAMDTTAAAAGPVNMIAMSGTLKGSAVGVINTRNEDDVSQKLERIALVGDKKLTPPGISKIKGASAHDSRPSNFQSVIWRLDSHNIITPELIYEGKAYSLTLTRNTVNNQIRLIGNELLFAGLASTEHICQVKFSVVIQPLMLTNA